MEPEAAAADAVHCGLCGGELEGAILMTCLHVLCRNCAPSPTSGGRAGHEGTSYICPVCCPPTSLDKTAASHNGMTSTKNVSRIAAQPCAFVEALKRRSKDRSELATSHGETMFDDEEDEDEEEESGQFRRGDDDDGKTINSETDPSSSSSSSGFVVVSCPQHSHRDAEQFCLSCHQLACSKCVISAHRKCAQHLVTCAEAVGSQRPQLNSLHSRLAQKVITSQDGLQSEQSRLKNIEERRASLIGQIRAQKEALVRALEEKEAQLVGEVNAALDKEKGRVEGRVALFQNSGRAAEGQLSVLEAVMSVKGEPEILSLVPSLHARLDSDSVDCACSTESDTSANLAFTVNKKLEEEVQTSELGRVAQSDGETGKGDNSKKRDESDLRLTLMTSFHARTREDTCDPLLTDLVLLPGGDVIVTDRDNKCVKKFNSTGHLLTHVPIPEVPSRIALVSHGRAAISVMNRKVLLFLSLLGTVRILSYVRVKKRYCFLAAAGPGLGQGQGQGQGQGECLLLAATSQCDVIDLITESGQLLRRLHTYSKGDRVSISRPLYLHAPPPPPPPPPSQSSSSSSSSSQDPATAANTTTATTVAALVVDSGRRLLFALTPEGRTTFTFRPKDENSLECPLGVATVGATGLILLADRDKNRVLLLGRRGSFLRQLLGEKEGLHKPCALYASLTSRLALTQVDGWVKVYKVE